MQTKFGVVVLLLALACKDVYEPRPLAERPHAGDQSAAASAVAATAVTIDFSSYGSGKTFDPQFYRSEGIVFPSEACGPGDFLNPPGCTSWFVGFIQGDAALVGDPRYGPVRATFTTPISQLSLRVAAAFQKTYTYELSALSSSGRVIATNSITVTDDASVGYVTLSLPTLPEPAEAFTLDNVFAYDDQFGVRFEYGVSEISYTLGDETPAEKAAAAASTLLDAPYLWAGGGWDFERSQFVGVDEIKTLGYAWMKGSVKTAAGVDCSGLVFWSYNKTAGATKFDPGPGAGPIEYRNSDGQYRNNTVAVSKAELKPGDLLFFDYTPGVPEIDHEIDHVAMFLGGDDVIEATQNASHSVSKVKLSKMSTLLTLMNEPGTKRAFVDFGQLVAAAVNIRFQTHSPVDLDVTDPDGLRIDARTLLVSDREQLREVPGELYYFDGDREADGTFEAEVISPHLKNGTYVVKVTPRSGVSPSATYSLDVQAAGKTIIFARDVLLQNIPDQGYGVLSTVTDIIAFTPLNIDVKPGSTDNPVNSRSRGKIPVAVLSTNVFNAANAIVRSSLTLGRTGSEHSLAFCNSKPEDVNGDGRPDLICHFYTELMDLRPGITSLVLQGTATDGSLIRGVDKVRIVH